MPNLHLDTAHPCLCGSWDQDDPPTQMIAIDAALCAYFGTGEWLTARTQRERNSKRGRQ